MLVNMQMPTAPASLARRSSAIASLAKSHGSEAIHFTSITIAVAGFAKAASSVPVIAVPAASAPLRMARR
jgi:hypothetical protein